MIQSYNSNETDCFLGLLLDTDFLSLGFPESWAWNCHLLKILYLEVIPYAQVRHKGKNTDKEGKPIKAYIIKWPFLSITRILFNSLMQWLSELSTRGTNRNDHPFTFIPPLSRVVFSQVALIPWLDCSCLRKKWFLRHSMLRSQRGSKAVNKNCEYQIAPVWI